MTPSEPAPETLPVEADLARIRRELDRVHRDAQKQYWYEERPWKPETHVWAEGALPTVDLHDLGVSLGKRAAEKVMTLNLQSGAVRFVVGVGRNTIGPAQMKPAIGSTLAAACQQHAGWSFRPDGPGSFVLITDPARAPREAKTSLPPGFWIGVALFGLALLYAIWRNLFGG